MGEQRRRQPKFLHGRTVSEQLQFTKRRARHRLGLWRRARRQAPTVADPVFVVASARSGSTLLVDYLDSLPGVSMAGEVLNDESVVGLRQRGMSHRARLRHVRRSIDALPGPVRGAKLMLRQLERNGIDFEDLRQLFPEARFVVLYRESLADQHVSQVVARATTQYRSTSAPDTAATSDREIQVVIDPERALAAFRATRMRYQRALADPWLRDRSMVVGYEQLARDPEDLFEHRVCPFLGLDYGPPRSRLQKQITSDLRAVVANWAEVEDLLRGPESEQHY